MDVISGFSGLKINKIILSMIISIMGFGFLIHLIFIKDNEFTVLPYFDNLSYYFILISLELTIVASTMYLAYRYRGSLVFGRSYFFLFMGFLFLVSGNVLAVAEKMYPSIVKIETHVEIPIISFFILDVFLFYYLYINIKSFYHNFKFKDVLMIVTVAVGLTSCFIIITVTNLSIVSFNVLLFIICLVAVIGSSFVAALSFFGVYVLKKQPIGQSWKILALGLLVLTIYDIWFHIHDTIKLPDSEPVVYIRYGSYLIIIYALYLHKKVF